MTNENISAFAGADLAAIVDIGSNSVRIMVCSNGKILFRDKKTTQLASGIENKKLAYKSINRTLDGIEELKNNAEDFCEKSGYKQKPPFYAFATAAVRNSVNGGEFCKAAYERFGIEIDVLSGESEAVLGLSGALGGKDGAIIDVGGGSTEVSVAKNGKIAYSKSVPLGAVVLSELCPREKSAAINKAQEFISDFGDFGGVSFENGLCGIGGTSNTLAYISCGARVYDREKQNGSVLTIEKLNDYLNEFFALPPEDLAEKYNLDIRRANVLPFGAAIIYYVLSRAGLDRFTMTEGDNLEGYYRYLRGVTAYEK